MRAIAAAGFATATLLLAGCGGGGSVPSDQPLAARGRAVFDSAGCGGCHTLSAAGAHGRNGPDFDTSERLTRAQIVQALNSGSGDMPSFRAQLSDEQERALAEFLYRAMRRR